MPGRTLDFASVAEPTALLQPFPMNGETISRGQLALVDRLFFSGLHATFPQDVQQPRLRRLFCAGPERPPDNLAALSEPSVLLAGLMTHQALRSGWLPR